MKNRGIAVIEGLVLIAMVLVCIALVLPRLQLVDTEKDKTTSISHLKALVGIYISGVTERKPMPKSKGHRFWLALYIGDPSDIESGVKIDDVYAKSSQVSNLLCPADKGARSEKEIKKAFEELIKNETPGWDSIDEDDTLYTSYAGPRSRRVFTDKASSGIVGCDGARSKKGFFSDGFCVVNNRQGAEFKEYDDLADRFPTEWTGDEEQPNWDSKLLETVYNLEDCEDRKEAKKAEKKDEEEKKPQIEPKNDDEGDDDDDDDDDDKKSTEKPATGDDRTENKNAKKEDKKEEDK